MAEWRRVALRILRDGATAVGFIAALGVVFGFLAAALGGYQH